MDNRAMQVQLRPRNRRRVVVSTDLVTGSMQGFKPDHFSLGNALKGIGNIAKATGVPIVSQVGGAVSGLVQQKQDTKAAANASIGTLTDYEGQLIRDKSNGKVYEIKNGVAIYVSKLPLPDGRGWSSVKDLPKLPPSGSVVKVTSVTPMISPLPMSVPSAPADAPIKAAIQASTQSNQPAPQTIAEKLVQQVEAIPQEQKQAILQKAQTIYDKGTNGVLTKAQKQLQNLSTSILPKTKAVKEAEAVLTAPQHSGEPTKGSTLNFSSPWVIGGIVAVIVGIIVIVAVRR